MTRAWRTKPHLAPEYFIPPRVDQNAKSEREARSRQGASFGLPGLIPPSPGGWAQNIAPEAATWAPRARS
jgi:hypothetical protein